MELNHTFKITPHIQKLLNSLENQKKSFELIPQIPQITQQLHRQSLLKSAVYSARIEGNTLEENEFKFGKTSKKRERLEIQNLVDALTWLHRQDNQWFDTDLIKKLHQKVTQHLNPEAGKFRIEPSAIYNQAGIAIYIAPMVEEIRPLINQLIDSVTSSKLHPAILAAISHYQFEKIHPFIDGNGRVGRLLTTQILRRHGLAFGGLLILEEYLEAKRQDYYDLLAKNTKDLTGWIEFFLETMVSQIELVFHQIEAPVSPESNLLPRRLELLNIIRDHRDVSFDFLHRRFLDVPASTLRYDLQQLQKQKFIRKLGKTRGVRYTI